MKAVPRGKCTAINTYVKKEENLNLTLHLKEVEKRSKLNPKPAEGRKYRQKQIQRINEI